MPQNNKKTIGVDFHGVLDSGFELPEKAIVITGANEQEEGEEIRNTLGDKVKIHFFDKHDELTDDNKDAKIGTWKAQMIKKLGVDKFYEDNDNQIEIIKAFNPKVEVVKVVDGIAAEPMKFICFTFDGTILPVAKKLQDEGNEVIVAMVDNNKNVFTDEQIKNKSWKPEEPKKKKDRWKLYNGILKMHKAEEVLKEMKSIKNKEDYFILADSNSLFRFTEQAYAMGFTKGFFPTEEDRNFEENRMKAKEFVKQNYPDIEVAEVQKFEKVADAIEFLNTSDKMWVLKSLGDYGDTVMAKTDDADQAKEQIISALTEHSKDYETDGFILEELIQNCKELTPQIVFYDGVPVYYTLDIENKPFGAGNIGFMVGCAQNLICHIEEEDPINKIAFPPIVYEMAKEHHGMFVWDIGLLATDDGKYYFTEFCSNRMGWDAFPTELSMCESLTLYFQKLILKQDPICMQYGAGVRVFNLTQGEPFKDAEISMEDEKGIFLYDAYDNLKTVGMLDLCVCTGASDDMYEAIEEAYENVAKITLESKSVRPKFDFVSYDYPTSILNRYNYYQSISNQSDEHSF